MEQPHQDIFAVQTDLGERLRLGDVETDKVIEQALLAIAGLNKRLEEMQSYNALAGFRSDEYSLLDQKLHFIVDQVDPRKQEERFDRVIELAGLPDPETAEGAVDVKRLLEVRDSEICREFRQWLRTLDQASDQEIEAQLKSLREALSRVVRSPAGKAVRFVTTTGIGAIPVVGQIAAPILGALDAFALERLIPEPGPVSFLSSSYPSIFRG